MKGIFNKIKDILLPHGYLDKEFGMTDEGFFLLVLDAVPDGAKIEFDQGEPDKWVTELRPWSFRANDSQFEADYYVNSKDFRQKIKELITAFPNEFYEIHHLTILSAGITYLDSLDNFTVVRLHNDFENILREKIKKITTNTHANKSR